MTQGNFFTGTTAGGDTLTVTDGTTTNTDVRKIIVSAGTVTASSGHTVTVTTGGGGGGGMTSWTIGSTTGANQTVSNGQVVDIVGGTGISGTIGGTRTVTLDLDDTAVTPGSYTYSSITVDQQGRLTAASSGTAPALSGSIANTQVAYGTGANQIGGEAAFTYTAGTNTLDVGVVTTTGTGVSVGGTGTVSTANGSISAGGASGSVAANTTITAGTDITATAGTISSDDGRLEVEGWVDGTITNIATVPGVLKAENSVLQRSYTDFTVTGGAAAASDIGDPNVAGASFWINGDNATFGTLINISLPAFKGMQWVVTAGVSTTITALFANVTTVMANGAIYQDPGGAAGVAITIPPYETAVFVVLGDLSAATSFGGGALGTKVVQVLGNVTAAVI